MEPSATIRTLGDILAPFAKKRKPKPKNPNAIQQLKNRRTEMANRERNNAANTNNQQSYLDPNAVDPLISSELEHTTSSSPLFFDENIIKTEELPPPRSKPLPHEIKILIAVLGTVGAIILILYIVKKFAYDKIHKNDSGKILHAYAHFRRFQKRKKRNGDKTSSGLETVDETGMKASQSSESGLGTMKTNEAEKTHTGKDATTHTHHQAVNGFQHIPRPPGRLQEGFRRESPKKEHSSAHRNGRLPNEIDRYSSDSCNLYNEHQNHQKHRKRRMGRSVPSEKNHRHQAHHRSSRDRSNRTNVRNSASIIKDVENEARLHDQKYRSKYSKSEYRSQKCRNHNSIVYNDDMSVFSADDCSLPNVSTWRDRAYM